MIQEVDYIELPKAYPVFEYRETKSTTFTSVAWYLSNFGKMSPHVWWGYKLGYYTVAFLPLFCLTLLIDLGAIVLRLASYMTKRVFDLLLSSMQTAIKVVLTAAAIIFIIMYIYNNGLDGMTEDYKYVCECLKCFVKPQ